MAYLRQAKSEEQIKALTVANVKKAYNELSADYNKVINQDYILCPVCGEFVTRDNFYTDKRFAIGVYPECKKCVLAEVEQRKNKNDKPNETKDSVKRMLQKMDLPYIDSLYESLCKDVADEVNEKNKRSPFLAYLPPIKSLPNWKGKTYADSEFEPGVIADEEEVKLNQKTIKAAKKRFGSGIYNNEQYMFLENEYQDWVHRYSCENKTEELLFQRICCKELEINEAQKVGKDTKELDKTLQDLLGSANLKPNQNRKNTLSDAQTFGQLIAKWEDSKPIPECEEEFKDVDKIGLYLDVFYKGHMAKMLNLKNPLSHIYEKFMKKYTVEKPDYDAEENSEALFDVIFGSSDKEDKL